MIIILIFFVSHWYLSLFMQTFFQHRYAAHGSFYMSKFWERFFYLVAYITQGSSYVSPKTYGIMHRMHHAYTDTEKDPHSPQYDKNIITIMWRTMKVSSNIWKGKLVAEAKFLKNLPDWRIIDRLAHSTWSRIGWSLVYFYFYLQFSPSAWFFLLIPIHIAMVPVQGVIINWFAHKYGSINFKLKNTSTNLFKLDLFMMGEAYHNNHHKNPSASNFGFRWYEIDFTFIIIRILSWLKIIRVHRLTPNPLSANRESSIVN